MLESLNIPLSLSFFRRDWALSPGVALALKFHRVQENFCGPFLKVQKNNFLGVQVKFKGSRTRTQSRVFDKYLPFFCENHDDSQTIATCRLIINGMIFSEYSTSKSMKFCQLVKLMIFFLYSMSILRPTLLFGSWKHPMLSVKSIPIVDA